MPPNTAIPALLLTAEWPKQDLGLLNMCMCQSRAALSMPGVDFFLSGWLLLNVTENDNALDMKIMLN